jgi:membrane protein insertase Oxa1/YidC/SpoIIIJ
MHIACRQPELGRCMLHVQNSSEAIVDGWSAIRTELVLRSGRFAVVAKGLPQFVANFLKKLVSFQWGRSCSFVTFSVRLTISWLNLAAATRSSG